MKRRRSMKECNVQNGIQVIIDEDSGEVDVNFIVKGELCKPSSREEKPNPFPTEPREYHLVDIATWYRSSPGCFWHRGILY
jgi:hypothetical protein